MVEISLPAETPLGCDKISVCVPLVDCDTPLLGRDVQLLGLDTPLLGRDAPLRVLQLCRDAPLLGRALLGRFMGLSKLAAKAAGMVAA